jgi:hypothetical protein
MIAIFVIHSPVHTYDAACDNLLGIWRARRFQEDTEAPAGITEGTEDDTEDDTEDY